MTAAFGADNTILYGSLFGHGGGYCQGSQFAAGMNEPNSATPLLLSHFSISSSAHRVQARDQLHLWNVSYMSASPFLQTYMSTHSTILVLQ